MLSFLDEDTVKMFLIVIIGIISIMYLIELYLRAESRERQRLKQRTENEVLAQLSTVKLHQKLNNITAAIANINAKIDGVEVKQIKQ